MSLSLHPRAWTRLLHAGLVALLATAVLAGSLELHSDHRLPELDALAVLHGGCHPELATHLEPPTTPHKPDCPACLLRLKLRGSHLLEARLAVVEPVVVRVSFETVRLERSASRSPRLSRGPPSQLA